MTGVQTCALPIWVKSTIELLKKIKTDVILLDIDLKDGTCFDILKLIPNPDFLPVFITAHNEYAIKAFKFSAVDYLVKPVDPEELVIALDKCSKLTKERNLQKRLEALDLNLNSKFSNPKKIVLKTEQNLHLVDVNDIVNCEADGNYTTVFLNSGEKIIVTKLIKDFEDLLSDCGFARVHQSHLINKNYLKSYKKQDNCIVLKNNNLIPVSVRKKAMVIALFENF